MKKTFEILTFFALLFLVSCGQGGKTSATLKVSSSFALSNGSFDGGLVVYGTNGDKSFARTISFTSGSNTSVSIVLPNGKWSFYGTGWKNSMGSPMSGDIFCGSTATPVDLRGTDATVSLTLTQNGCLTDQFTNDSFRDAVGPNRVKKFTLVSCNAFYEDVAGSLQEITRVTSPDYCGSMAHPLDLRNQAKSFKISVQSKAIAGETLPPGFVSSCQIFQSGGTNGVNSSEYTNFRIPSKNVPVSVTLYEDDGCSKILSSQPMLDGLSHDYGVDKFLLDGTSTHAGLVLPSNQTRKGYSHFINLLPGIKCNSGLCVDQFLSGDVFYSYAARPIDGTFKVSVPIDHDPDAQESAYTNVSIGASTGWTLGPCSKSHRSFRCEMTLLNDCSGEVCSSLAGRSFIVNFEKHSQPFTRKTHVFKFAEDLESLALAAQLTGSGAVRPHFVTDANSSEKMSGFSRTGEYGALSSARFLLSPTVSGNIFDRSKGCETASGKSQFSFKDEDGTKTYELEVSNPSILTGYTYEHPFFCDENLYATMTCPPSPNSIYNRRLTLRRLLGPGQWERIFALEIGCDKSFKAGRIQELSKDAKRREDRIVTWLTPSSGMERLESYHHEWEYLSDGTKDSYGASFHRMVRYPSTQDLFINSMRYSRSYNSEIDFNESANRTFLTLLNATSTANIRHNSSSISKSNSIEDLANPGSNTSMFDGSFSDPEAVRTSVYYATYKRHIQLPVSTTNANTTSMVFATSSATTAVGEHPLKVESLRPEVFKPTFTNDNFFGF